MWEENNLPVLKVYGHGFRRVYAIALYASNGLFSSILSIEIKDKYFKNIL